MAKKKISTKATMSVYERGQHRTVGLPYPANASIEEGLSIFKDMLMHLQARGVHPGTKLKITIETM